jgi:hypothetical protein
VGLLLVLAPWSAIWERNYFVEHLPWVAAIARNNFVRGAVSGLGVVNLAAGIAELLSLFAMRRRS